MTYQANLEGAVQMEDLHATVSPVDDAPHVTRRPRQIGDYAAPVVGFAGFIGFWYFMSYWALEHIWNKPSFLITPPHRVFNILFVALGLAALEQPIQQIPFTDEAARAR